MENTEDVFGHICPFVAVETLLEGAMKAEATSECSTTGRSQQTKPDEHRCFVIPRSSILNLILSRSDISNMILALWLSLKDLRCH